MINSTSQVPLPSLQNKQPEFSQRIFSSYEHVPCFCLRCAISPSVQQPAELVSSFHGATALLHGVLFHCLYFPDHVSNTFFYRVTYAPSFAVPLRPAWHGGRCDHGFDLLLTQGLPLMGDFLPEGMGTNDEDEALAKIVIRYWANFVKTGVSRRHISNVGCEKLNARPQRISRVFLLSPPPLIPVLR